MRKQSNTLIVPLCLTNQNKVKSVAFANSPSSMRPVRVSFEQETVENVKRGYTGNDPGVKIWTFSAALMFSLTVFTTIGKSGTFYHMIYLLHVFTFTWVDST